MPVMDEFREQRETIKNEKFRKKLAYYWGYYKWYVLGGLTVILLGVWIVHDIILQKDDVLYGAVVNGYLTQQEDLLESGFTEYLDLDTEKYAVTFNSSLRLGTEMTTAGLEASQFLMTYTAGGDLDVMIMDPQPFAQYSYTPTFADLRELLSEEMLASLSDRLYYIDYAVALEIEQLSKDGKSTDDVVLPDPFKPEEMEDPMPVGIVISDCEHFTDAYYYEDGVAYLGIVVNSTSKEYAVKFVDYLFSE